MLVASVAAMKPFLFSILQPFVSPFPSSVRLSFPPSLPPPAKCRHRSLLLLRGCRRSHPSPRCPSVRPSPVQDRPTDRRLSVTCPAFLRRRRRHPILPFHPAYFPGSPLSLPHLRSSRSRERDRERERVVGVLCIASMLRLSDGVSEWGSPPQKSCDKAGAPSLAPDVRSLRHGLPAAACAIDQRASSAVVRLSVCSFA